MFIFQAYAADKNTPTSGGFEMLIILGVFAVVFYLMIYRPQAKRIKERKILMSSMLKGDEVLTSGGLVGKITRISKNNDCILIELNKNNEVIIKKDFVTAVLPKGTIKSL
ncbi:membrane protein yajC [Candidatus Photodesmus blepharus]|uniref:Sec translocon accessory complex subunit YajC n=1 Tax=Candidatus Photodesmus blepharonis TaxID=1179155 RepID=A0A084CPD0_9GAMM|nr:preprotein translocase subunit YajC [Candidatus Photodesmus blepharus]KEY91659.1 membrane protein yajC [Candidatus Photodesmus blepharus]